MSESVKPIFVTFIKKTILLVLNSRMKEENEKEGTFSKLDLNRSGISNITSDSDFFDVDDLFIDEYDVMASHGVAIGSINKDDLFYLMSRGLTKEAASNMVIMGLIEPVLKAIDNEEYATKFRNNFQQNLK